MVKDEPDCSSEDDAGLEPAERERDDVRTRLRNEGATVGDVLDTPALVGILLWWL